MSAADDTEVLRRAQELGLIVVSHDVGTMRARAEARIRDGSGIRGLFLAPQRYATRRIAESLVMIWSASDAEEWRDRIVYLPL